MRKFKAIITHGGVFHADDVFSVAFLRSGLGVHLPVCRRDPTPEEMADPEAIKVDVGGKFDPICSCYDHHQKGGAGERDTDGPFASFGLLWHHFSAGLAKGGKALDCQLRVDMLLVRGIDASDCGKGHRTPRGASPSISQCISWLNPGPQADGVERDLAFSTAVEVAQRVLDGAMKEAEAWVEAKDAVLAAEAQDKVLILQKFVPWAEHVFTRPDQAELLYVVFPSERGGFMVQQIPVAPDSFQGRKALPEAWAGLRDAALQEKTGVSDAVFVHPGRFCGGAATLGSTLQMAKLAVHAG